MKTLVLFMSFTNLNILHFELRSKNALSHLHCSAWHAIQLIMELNRGANNSMKPTLLVFTAVKCDRI